MAKEGHLTAEKVEAQKKLKNGAKGRTRTELAIPNWWCGDGPHQWRNDMREQLPFNNMILYRNPKVAWKVGNNRNRATTTEGFDSDVPVIEHINYGRNFNQV